ncbi:MAG: sodium:solute symporter family protein [Clostridiaceae bacterium]|nr:sodium:solute symporter family protein [Clostridiaceae bacterium]
MSFLDYVIFIGMIVVTGLVGVLSSKKVKNADEYIMANRSLNKLQTGFSMAATDFGGSALVVAIGYCYISGFGGIWWNLAAAPAFLFVGLYLAKKLNRLQSKTVPDYLGIRYSPGCKLLSGSMHFLANIALLSTQFTISTATFAVITGFNPTITLVFVTLLVVGLTMMGGLRAVVNTDATLFVFIVASVIACLILSVSKAGGLAGIFVSLPEGFTSIGSIGFAKPISWILMCIFSYSTNQNYVQRMLASKDENTASFSALFTAGFYVVISVALGLIGMAAHILMPGLNDMNSIFPKLIMQYFPAGLIGLGVAGVLAATISTASSILHSATTLFVSDIYKELNRGKKDASLTNSRITTLCISLGALVLSIVAKNIVELIYIASLFYSTSVFFPLLIGMNSTKVTARGAMVSIIGAVLSGLVWELFIFNKINLLGAIPSNLISVFISLALLLYVSRLDRESEKRRQL